MRRSGSAPPVSAEAGSGGQRSRQHAATLPTAVSTERTALSPPGELAPDDERARFLKSAAKDWVFWGRALAVALAITAVIVTYSIGYLLSSDLPWSSLLKQLMLKFAMTSPLFVIVWICKSKHAAAGTLLAAGSTGSAADISSAIAAYGGRKRNSVLQPVQTTEVIEEQRLKVSTGTHRMNKHRASRRAGPWSRRPKS